MSAMGVRWTRKRHAKGMCHTYQPDETVDVSPQREKKWFASRPHGEEKVRYAYLVRRQLLT